MIKASETANGKTRHSHADEPKEAFTALIQEGELMISLSYGGTEVDDGEGNIVIFHLWVSGDWKVEYKGKEYLIPMSENINALIEWINAQEAKP